MKSKNLRKINNKTLVEFAINYAKTSKYIKEIYVSTDSDEIKKIAISNNVKPFDRPEDLLGEAEVADIYVDLINKIPNIKMKE